MKLYHGSNQEFDNVDLKKSKDKRDFGKGFYTRRKIPNDKIMYNGQDINFIVIQKTEHIVNIIAEKENISFDSAYAKFLASRLYMALQNPASLLWAENAEFIADEYYREEK